MKNTEKEKLNINQFANEEQQLMNENSLYECLETYDQVISYKKIETVVVKRFESYSSQKQVLLLNSICNLLTTKYKTDEYFDLIQVQVDNFLELWNVLKSEDVKTEFAYKIDNSTIRFDKDFMISKDSLIYKFYNNKYYDEFNKKINENKNMSTL